VWDKQEGSEEERVKVCEEQRRARASTSRTGG
jgi:hypothetical protein